MRQTSKSHPEKNQRTNQNQTTQTRKTNQSPPFAIHQSLLTRRAWEAHTEKAENLGPPSSPLSDNTVPLLLFLCNNGQAWAPLPQPSPLPPPTPGLPQSLLPLLPQPPRQLQPHSAEQPNQELMIALGTLWQPLCAEWAPGAHQAEEEAE